jgi:hypothetical protein
MAVGNQPTVAGINNSLSSYALQMRELTDQILNFQQFLNGAAGLGSAGLVAIGYSTADAATVLAMANYLNTIAQVYRGTATQGTLFNFSNATSPLWAGQ